MYLFLFLRVLPSYTDPADSDPMSRFNTSTDSLPPLFLPSAGTQFGDKVNSLIHSGHVSGLLFLEVLVGAGCGVISVSSCGGVCGGGNREREVSV